MEIRHNKQLKNIHEECGDTAMRKSLVYLEASIAQGVSRTYKCIHTADTSPTSVVDWIWKIESIEQQSKAGKRLVQNSTRLYKPPQVTSGQFCTTTSTIIPWPDYIIWGLHWNWLEQKRWLKIICWCSILIRGWAGTPVCQNMSNHIPLQREGRN